MGKEIAVGEHIILRLMTGEDTALILKWRNHERVRRNFIYRELFTEESHGNWMKSEIETGHAVQFIIETKQGNTPIGSVYFRDIETEPPGAEYGIFIGEDEAIGKGYGTETAIVALRYAFEVMKLKRLKLRVFSDNTAAVRSYEKAGFSKVAYTQVVCSDGEKKQIDLMELSDQEWKEKEEKRSEE